MLKVTRPQKVLISDVTGRDKRHARRYTDSRPLPFLWSPYFRYVPPRCPVFVGAEDYGSSVVVGTWTGEGRSLCVSVCVSVYVKIVQLQY